MHLYIYDDFLEKSKYSKTLNKIETRITDLGLNGKIIRLSNLKNIESAIWSEVKRGARTLVVVGNDGSFNKVLKTLLAKEVSFFLSEVFLAFIPVETSQVALSLGIKSYADACNILLARRTENIKVAKANNYFFLSQAEILSKNISINIEGNYNIKSDDKSSIYVINMPSFNISKLLPKKIDPRDEYLHIYINNKGHSFIPVKKLEVSSTNKAYITLDNSTQIELPCTLSMSDKELNLIVGKNRVFL
jgi:diacylglycerol kinase family enzyme